jgi:ssDNA-binding Zn-finger/Zn-ribbon topoisomerase 1
MQERTILADCCEDWILQFGRYYPPSEDFSCPECGTPWQKLAAGRFRRAGDGQTFVERSRGSEGAEFRYLSAEDATEPLVERCCAQILLRYGERMPLAGFRCPVCHTQWTRDTIQRSGIELTCFRKEGLEGPFVIQPGSPRHFLVPLSGYRLPRE